MGGWGVVVNCALCWMPSQISGGPSSRIGSGRSREIPRISLWACRAAWVAAALGAVLVGCAGQDDNSKSGDMTKVCDAATDLANGDAKKSGASAPICGNSVCEPGETAAACAADCNKAGSTAGCSSFADISAINAVAGTIWAVHDSFKLVSRLRTNCLSSTGKNCMATPTNTLECVANCVKGWSASGFDGTSAVCRICLAQYATCAANQCKLPCAAGTESECYTCAVATCGDVADVCSIAFLDIPTCGNSLCDGDEDQWSCPADCK